MKKSSHSSRKSALSFLLLFFFCSACFSETVFKITEGELNQIQEKTAILTEIVNEQNKQLQQYQILSEKLRNEAENQKKVAQMYKGIAAGACAASVLLSGALYFSKR